VCLQPDDRFVFHGRGGYATNQARGRAGTWDRTDPPDRFGHCWTAEVG
jgi:hypothetical protein